MGITLSLHYPVRTCNNHMSGQLLGYLWDAPPLRRPFSCLKKQVLTDIPVFSCFKRHSWDWIGFGQIWNKNRLDMARLGEYRWVEDPLDLHWINSFKGCNWWDGEVGSSHDTGRGAKVLCSQAPWGCSTTATTALAAWFGGVTRCPTSNQSVVWKWHF